MNDIFIETPFKSIENFQDLQNCIENITKYDEESENYRAGVNFLSYGTIFIALAIYMTTNFLNMKGFSMLDAAFLGIIASFFGTASVGIADCSLYKLSYYKNFCLKLLNLSKNFRKMKQLEKEHTQLLTEALHDKNIEYSIISFLQSVSQSYFSVNEKSEFIDNSIKYLIECFSTKNYGKAQQYLLQNFDMWKNVKNKNELTFQTNLSYQNYIKEMNKVIPQNISIEREHETGSNTNINLKSIL